MKKSARIKNCDTGEIIYIYGGQTLNLPEGLFELLDPLPTNASLIGSTQTKTQLVKERKEKKSS